MEIDQSQLQETFDKTSKSTLATDLILELKKKELALKKSIETCDILFVNKTISKQNVKICHQETRKQSDRFQEYLRIYQELDEKHQRPYKAMVKRFKAKVDHHQNLLKGVQSNKHLEYIDSKKQIWEQQFESQSPVKYYGRAILGILGALLLHCLFGAIYRWAMINAYITSYYKITNDPYIETSQDAIGAPLSMLAAGITMKQSIKVCKLFESKLKLGKILFLFIIVLLSAGQIVIASLMPSYIFFIVFHNFLYGFTVGCLFLTSVSECQKYLEKHKLLVTSIVLTGGGFGCVFFGLLNTYCFNPDSISPTVQNYYTGESDYVARRVPFCFQYMSVFVLIIGIVGCLMLIPITLYNNDEVVIEYRIKTRKSFENQCYTQGEALKSQIFFIILVIIVLASMGNFFMTMNYKNIPGSKIHNEEFLALVALAGMLGNGFFRFVWGGIVQNFGFKWAFLIAMVLNIFSFVSIPLAINYYNFYLLSYTIAGTVAGGLMVLMTSLSLLVFGEVGNQMFGYLWGAFTLSNFIQYLMGATIAKIVPHYQLIIFFAATSLVALIISSIVKYQGRWQNSLEKLQY